MARRSEPGGRFQDGWLIRHAAALDRDADLWAYSPAFEALAARYRAENRHAPSDRDLYRHLIAMRKRRAYVTDGGPILAHAERRPPRKLPLTEREVAVIRDAYAAQRLPRDRLPYTPEFEGMYAKWRDSGGTDVGLREFWRWVVSLAKQKALPLKGRRVPPAPPPGRGFLPL